MTTHYLTLTNLLRRKDFNVNEWNCYSTQFVVSREYFIPQDIYYEFYSIGFSLIERLK